MSSKTIKVVLAAAVFAAFLFRLGLAIYGYPNWMHGMTLAGEARNIFDGYGYTLNILTPGGELTRVPSVYDVPAYAYLHAFFWKLFGGYSLFYAQLLQCFLDSLLCLVVYRMAREILSTTGAVVAACLYAVYLPEATLAANVGRDFWSTATFLLSTFTFLLFLQGRGWKWLVGCGLILGIGCYFRPMPIYFPLFLGLAFWVRSHNMRRAILYTTVLFALVFTMLFPWGFRNYNLTGKWIFTRNVMGQALWMGAGQFKNPYGAINQEGLALQQMQERGFIGTSNSTIEYEEFIRPLAVQMIKENPWWYVTTVLKRIPMTLLINRIPWANMGSQKYSYHQAMYIGHEEDKNVINYALAMLKLDPWFIVTKVFDTILLGLTFLGLYVRRAHWREDFILWSVPTYLILIHIPFGVEGRYMVPGHWVYLIFASVAMQYLSQHRRVPDALPTEAHQGI